MIDTTLRETSESCDRVGEQHPRQAPQVLGESGGGEFLDGGAAVFGLQITAGDLLPVMADGQDVASLVIAGFQRRQPLVPHQHQEFDLGKVLRGRGIEPAGASFRWHNAGLPAGSAPACNRVRAIGSGERPFTG